MNENQDNTGSTAPEHDPRDDEQQALAEHGITVEPGGASEPESARRAASITLRRDSDDDRAVSLDPAHQSLNQALRASFTLLKLVMVVLFILFVTSGFRTIQEGQRGLRLVFGAIQDDDAVGSGAIWTYPQPIGELVIVRTDTQNMTITSFLPNRRGQTDADWSQIRRSPSAGLIPGQDGYVLTSDGNIVHAGWTVTYRFDDVVKLERNIARTSVDDVIRVAMERGVVHAIARTTIDNPDEEVYDILLGSGEAIVSMVRRKAQSVLDGLDSGIKITSVTLKDAMPPLGIRTYFEQVSNARSEARRQEQEARQSAEATLQRVAGPAYPRLVELIDRYDRDLSDNDEARADATLARINAILDGHPLEEDAGVYVSGEVPQRLERARAYHNRVVQQARIDYERFQAALDQFREAPDYTIMKYWHEAFLAISEKETTQKIIVPEGADTIEIIISTDPDVARDIEAERRETGRSRRQTEYEESL
ncbi:MAG: hypothetical protein KAS72_10475 [Phycisphaerales bacterium]|nr:hypothetical protein [Phycisphaerales bacterium]